MTMTTAITMATGITTTTRTYGNRRRCVLIGAYHRKAQEQESGMAKNAIVSDELAQKFATEKETPYTRWVAKEGLEIISALYVRSLHTVELKPWPRRGGRGVLEVCSSK